MISFLLFCSPHHLAGNTTRSDGKIKTQSFAEDLKTLQVSSLLPAQQKIPTDGPVRCVYTHTCCLGFVPLLHANRDAALQGAGSSPCGHPVRALKLSQGTGSPSPHNLTPYVLPPSSPVQSGLPASPTPPSYPIKLLQPWGLRSCKSIFSQQAQSNQVKKQISV